MGFLLESPVQLADSHMLVQEILSRKLRDRRAVARYAGLTGLPDISHVVSAERLLRSGFSPQ
jgi:transposase